MIPSLIPRATVGAARRPDGYRTQADLLVAEQSTYGSMYGESRRELLDQKRNRAWPPASAALYAFVSGEKAPQPEQDISFAENCFTVRNIREGCL